MYRRALNGVSASDEAWRWDSQVSVCLFNPMLLIPRQLDNDGSVRGGLDQGVFGRRLSLDCLEKQWNGGWNRGLYKLDPTSTYLRGDPPPAIPILDDVGIEILAIYRYGRAVICQDVGIPI